jgi:hypothetical protein
VGLGSNVAIADRRDQLQAADAHFSANIAKLILVKHRRPEQLLLDPCRRVYRRRRLVCRRIYGRRFSTFPLQKSVAAIELRGETHITASGMCLSLGKSLPRLRHFNQKGLEPEDQRPCECLADIATAYCWQSFPTDILVIPPTNE